MKIIFPVVSLIIFVLIITILIPDLSFTRTGGQDFESITPPVHSSYTMNDIIELNESSSKEVVVDEVESSTKVIFKELSLIIWDMDAQYYFGKQLNKNNYDDFKLPSSYNIPSYSSSENEILAVKTTYLDLTNYGKKRLHALISKDDQVRNVKNIDDYTLMEYDNYQLLLKDNVLYYFRVK